MSGVVRLQPTRVRRRYHGGALLAAFRGAEEEDGLLPEDWLGSDTLAKDGGPSGTAGLSRLADGRLLRDAIATDPKWWLGELGPGGRRGEALPLLVP